jgi:hypothetical protein
MAAVIWVKALKAERCLGRRSDENSLMWPMIVSAMVIAHRVGQAAKLTVPLSALAMA